LHGAKAHRPVADTQANDIILNNSSVNNRQSSLPPQKNESNRCLKSVGWHLKKKKKTKKKRSKKGQKKTNIKKNNPK